MNDGAPSLPLQLKGENRKVIPGSKRILAKSFGSVRVCCYSRLVEVSVLTQARDRVPPP